LTFVCIYVIDFAIILSVELVMECKHCGSKSLFKDGFIRDKQRYCCRSCNKISTNTLKRGKPESLKILALLLYISGISQRRIATLCGVSDVAVMKWLKIFAQKLGELPTPEGDEIIIEIDEMHHFIGSKKTNVGYGKPFVRIQVK
jgi:transposase